MFYSVCVHLLLTTPRLKIFTHIFVHANYRHCAESQKQRRIFALSRFLTVFRLSCFFLFLNRIVAFFTFSYFCSCGYLRCHLIVNRVATSGAAVVYIPAGNNQWTEETLLQGNEGDDENFGASISLSSGAALIGAPNYNNGAGLAYLYQGDQVSGLHLLCDILEKEYWSVIGVDDESRYRTEVGCD